EVSRGQQVRQGHFPLFAFEKVIRDPVSFFGDTRLADIGSKTTRQKLAEQRMESIFLARLTIAGNGKKHILLRELGECCRTAQMRKQRAAEIELQRFEQRQIHQQSLRISRLARKNLFSEIIEDVAF